MVSWCHGEAFPPYTLVRQCHNTLIPSSVDVPQRRNAGHNAAMRAKCLTGGLAARNFALSGILLDQPRIKNRGGGSSVPAGFRPDSGPRRRIAGLPPLQANPASDLLQYRITLNPFPDTYKGPGAVGCNCVHSLGLDTIYGGYGHNPEYPG